ncbi:MAG: hypothetical protein O2798_10070 [Chloroflexi bacterium]|nr:hypothetical protein [Chloroflexota bacterium]MDA1241168.1 hypothetical protein [Chloroflexota bacterium]
MPLRMWCFVAGLLAAIAIPLVLTDASAGGLLLILPLALVLGPLGWLAGYIYEQLRW